MSELNNIWSWWHNHTENILSDFKHSSLSCLFFLATPCSMTDLSSLARD